MLHKHHALFNIQHDGQMKYDQTSEKKKGHLSNPTRVFHGQPSAGYRSRHIPFPIHYDRTNCIQTGRVILLTFHHDVSYWLQAANIILLRTQLPFN